MSKKIAIIIGAGPAGLTAAYELLEKTDITPIIYEMTDVIGGIARTVNFKGNRIDIGPHRFFSKSGTINKWWQDIFPIQGAPSKDDIVLKRNKPFSIGLDAPDPEKTDRVMLIRDRFTRILFQKKFFDYPLSLDFETLFNLDIKQTIKILVSYIRARFFPIKEEKTLEDFFINRFGKELYLVFFKNYTHKLWGIPASNISAEWGAQRVKGLSITKALAQPIRNKLFSENRSLSQRNIETSLIKQFFYPKLGPGQFWEEVARIVREKGGEIYTKHKVTGLKHEDGKVIGLDIKDEVTGEAQNRSGDFFFSTMPIKDLVQSFGKDVPSDVSRVANGLMYRDCVIVGLLLSKLKIENKTRIKTMRNVIPDNWIYIQEKDLKLARIQIYNNWSPYLIKDANTVWIGAEYFCNEGDEFWNMRDEEIIRFAVKELNQIGFISRDDILESIALRMLKTYPVYFGTYNQFQILKDYTNKIENLFLIGRNGMHRYNNMDHSMLTAITAVDNVIKGIISKDNIWNINTEGKFHE